MNRKQNYNELSKNDLIAMLIIRDAEIEAYKYARSLLSSTGYEKGGGWTDTLMLQFGLKIYFYYQGESKDLSKSVYDLFEEYKTRNQSLSKQTGEGDQTGEWTSAWKCLPMILKGKEFRYAESGIIIPYESIGLVQGVKGAFLTFQTIKDDLISIIAVSTRNVEWFDKSYVKY